MKIILLLIILFMSACTPQEKLVWDIEPEEIYEEEEEEEEEEPGDPFYGLAPHPLTGVWQPEELAIYRPLALVVSNIPQALPQSGLAQADIIFEVLAEGGITRLVAIFTQGDAEKIGPMRSTRDYFAHFAHDFGALLAHHGGSPTGYSMVRTLGLPNADGMSLESRYFWRDRDRVRRGALEHSSYTNIENLRNFMNNRGINQEFVTNVPFNFYKEFTEPLGFGVRQVTIPFSNFHTAVFVYDEETFTFRRYQRGRPHMDENTDEQLEASNIIIQRTPMHVIAGDPELRMNVSSVGSGQGYLVTGGRYMPITWEKADRNSQTLWRSIDGEPITLNPGQTWIAVVPVNANINFDFSLPED